jgi:hypothetical protein
MGWTIGVLGFDSRRGLGIFLFTIASRTSLGHTQPPIQWVPGALSLGVNRPGREADHLPPSNAEVKKCVELSTLPTRLHGAVLSSAQDSEATEKSASINKKITTIRRYKFSDRGWEFLSSTPRPERLWSTPSLLSYWYQGLFPWE